MSFILGSTSFDHLPQQGDAEPRVQAVERFTLNNLPRKDVMGQRKTSWNWKWELMTNEDYENLLEEYDTHLNNGEQVAFTFSEQSINTEVIFEITKNEIVPGTDNKHNVEIVMQEA